MKRITALALLLCLLAPLSVSARAEAAPFRFMTSAMNLVEEWLREYHPNLEYENLSHTADAEGTDVRIPDGCSTPCKAGTAPTCSCWKAPCAILKRSSKAVWWKT